MGSRNLSFDFSDISVDAKDSPRKPLGRGTSLFPIKEGEDNFDEEGGPALRHFYRVIAEVFGERPDSQPFEISSFTLKHDPRFLTGFHKLLKKK